MVNYAVATDSIAYKMYDAESLIDGKTTACNVRRRCHVTTAGSRGSVGVT